MTCYILLDTNAYLYTTTGQHWIKISIHLDLIDLLISWLEVIITLFYTLHINKHICCINEIESLSFVTHVFKIMLNDKGHRPVTLTFLTWQVSFKYTLCLNKNSNRMLIIPKSRAHQLLVFLSKCSSVNLYLVIERCNTWLASVVFVLTFPVNSISFSFLSFPCPAHHWYFKLAFSWNGLW